MKRTAVAREFGHGGDRCSRIFRITQYEEIQGVIMPGRSAVFGLVSSGMSANGVERAGLPCLMLRIR